MTDKIFCNNQAIIAGEVISDFVFSHEVFGEGFYVVEVLVKRLSDASDVIPYMVSDRLIDVSKSIVGKKIEKKIKAELLQQNPQPNPQSTGGGYKTKAEIMAIKDTNQRQKAIAENMHLFK